jgi:autotransporter-associated beta strand protein
MKAQNQTPRIRTAFAVALTACLCVIATRPALAATDIWNGGAVPDGNWLNPGNWNGVVPATNDLLVFTGGTQTATTNNFPAGTPFNNLAFSSGAGTFTLNGNSLTLSSPTDAGSGQIAGGSINNASSGIQTVRLPVAIANGNHTISSGSGLLKLNGPITRSSGAVVTMSGNINVTGGLSTNGSANGILGGWAIYNNNWATLDASSNVIAYAAYTDVSPGGTLANNATANVRIPTSGAAVGITTPTTAINSLLYSGGTAAQTINIGAGNKLVLGQNGGIFNSSAITSAGTYRNLTIGASIAAGGSLTAGDGVNPATITFGSAPLPNASGFCTVNSSITDNGSAPVTVVVAGAYVSLNGGGNAATTNTYSGGTYILQGRVSQPGRYTFGTGPVYIVSGGQANIGTQPANDFYLEGSGTVENQGMGVLRLYAASAANGYVGNLSGTIHLTGAAAVGANNTSFAAAGAQFIGISGKITGPGSLLISSPTATANGAGTVNIGSTNGISAIPNDYTGDTVINGTAGGTVNSTLRICDPADNNIIPHGLTGSYAGGKTGDLILNATAASRQAIFDLNGTTQTINGLRSTAASPVNNLIVDSGAGNGTLVVGDSDATSTFGGVIQNSVVIKKIGAGTLTLSGANTYNGDTLINTGRLVTTTAATGSGNYFVATNAALGVIVANPGTTLNVNNLTLGAAALQLNAGSFGNPSAPVVNVGGALAMSSNVTVSLSGVGLTAGGPFTVLTYNAGNRSGPGAFVLNNSPRIAATLNDDGVGNVTVTITSADSAVKWNGGGAGNWDISNAGNSIWQTVPSGNPTYYIESGSGNDVVLFNDFLTGTSNVNLTTTLAPQGITVSNSAVKYLFTGNGKLTGATGLTKNGNGTLTLANSGNNDFSGNLTLTAGTLVISNNSALANSISGGGALTKSGNGTLTLSGDNSSFTGPVTVNGGTLKVLNTVSLATASATTIASGATLDIGNNNVALGFEPITVSGSGVGGNGAIINSSGYSGGALSTSFQTLTMTGNTTIGGPGRIDFRSSDVNGGTDATLNTGGNAYKLTKVSGNLLQLGSVQIDAALGDIEVQAGILGIQGNMPSLGNPANALTVFGGATVQFLNLSTEVQKALVLKDGGIVNNSGGFTTYDGPVTLQGNGLFNIAGSGLNFTNVISGTGSVFKVTGNAQMTLLASNTYTGNTTISAGTLALTEPGDIRTSATITLGTGATLDVYGRNDQTLTVLGGHSLTGSGTLNGNLTNLPASTFAPGTPTATGTFAVNGNVTLFGTTVMKLNRPASDVLNSGGALNYGGTLVVTNLAGTLAAGDQFQLFNGGIAGNFTNIILPPLGSGLAWNTNALGSGLLSVSQGFAITNFTLSGTILTLQGAGGIPFGNVVLLGSTNVARPLNQWIPLLTNTVDGDGVFSFTTNINYSLPQQFYRLSQ